MGTPGYASWVAAAERDYETACDLEDQLVAEEEHQMMVLRDQTMGDVIDALASSSKLQEELNDLMERIVSIIARRVVAQRQCPEL